MSKKLLSWLKKRFSKKDRKDSGRCKNIVASGTTVLAIKFGNGVILGADGRIVALEFARVVKNNSKKTLTLGPNAVGYSGNTHVLKSLNRCLKKHFSGRIMEEIGFDEVVSKVKTHLEEYEDYEIDFSALVVGKLNDKWSIFEVKVDGKTGKVSEREVNERYAAVGSGADYVKLFLTKPKLLEYPLEAEVERRMKLVFDTLKYSVTKDYGTGGKLHVISIDAEGAVRHFLEIQPNGSDYCKSKYEAVGVATFEVDYEVAAHHE